MLLCMGAGKHQVNARVRENNTHPHAFVCSCIRTPLLLCGFLCRSVRSERNCRQIEERKGSRGLAGEESIDTTPRRMLAEHWPPHHAQRSAPLKRKMLPEKIGGTVPLILRYYSTMIWFSLFRGTVRPCPAGTLAHPSDMVNTCYIIIIITVA